MFFKGSSQKKITAPDMFTESDDMFAAYFDVGSFTKIHYCVCFVLRCFVFANKLARTIY